MPKINRSSKRSSSKFSSRTHRRIIRLENQDALLANNNMFLAPVDSSSRSVTNLNVSTNLSIHLDNVNTIEAHEVQNLDSNLLSDHHDNNVPTSLPTIPLNFEKPSKYVNNNLSIDSELKEWAVKCKIAQCHLNELLIILRKHKGFETLPKDSRTLLQTPKINFGEIRSINQNGKYFHFGLTNHLLNYFSNVNIPNEIQLVIGIDGLPISHSSNSQLWPILAYVKPNNYLLKKKVFIIGLYWGKSKPIDSNEFLLDFVNEVKLLLSNGLQINQLSVPVRIFAFCCDAPAKSFLTKTKGHTGLASCSKCTQEGIYLCNRTCFPYKAEMSPCRTHNSFVLRWQEDYHVSNINSILLDLPHFNIVDSFSLDYMHLTCLGVMRKLVLLWLKGPLLVRLPSSKVKQISSNLRFIKKYVPIEFSRKPRDLEEICRWKATELRQLLLYTGPLVFKNCLSDRCYTNFMSFHIAMVILISPNLGSYLQFAQDLLNYFVKSFEVIYGKHLISHNIHGLLHLCEDYKLFGPLDNVSCFPFENFMKTFKVMLRKHEKPLEQIVKRYKEIEINTSYKPSSNQIQNNTILKFQHNNGPLPTSLSGYQYKTLILTNKLITLKINKESDSYFGTANNDIVKVFNIITDINTKQIVIVGKIFTKKNVFYENPIKSSKLGIFIVNKLSNDFKFYSVNDVVKKFIIVSSYNGHHNNNIAMPILHNDE